MSEKQSILFLCGSPQGDKSSSLLAARYLSQFLMKDFEFVDVAAACLSFDASEAEEAFHAILTKMEEAACIVWVFGAVCWHAPVQLKLLFDKLFQQDFRFPGKIAATIMTGGHFLDDYILEHMRLINEQLGFGYLGDISAEGIAGGYVDHEETESSCRFLARMINTALDEGFVPYRETAPLRHEDLRPQHFAKGFAIKEDARLKKGSKRIVVVSGYKLENNPAARSIFDAIQAYSNNHIHLIEVEQAGLNPCKLNQECILNKDLACSQHDTFQNIIRALKEADGVIYIGHCASTFVDAHLLTLIGRQGSMLIMPQLTGKYGFSIATGGGGLGKDVALYLDKILKRLGVHSIAALTDGDNREGDSSDFAETLRWTTRQLDAALEEKWKFAEHFTAKSEHFFMREIAAKFGFIVQGMYSFYRNNNLFDYPSLNLTRLLVLFVRGRRLRNFMISQVAKTNRKQWESRLRRDVKKYAADIGNHK